MSAARLHVGAQRAGVAVSVIATWPDEVDVADIEEAVKTAARDAIRQARERTRQNQ